MRLLKMIGKLSVFGWSSLKMGVLLMRKSVPCLQTMNITVFLIRNIARTAQIHNYTCIYDFCILPYFNYMQRRGEKKVSYFRGTSVYPLQELVFRFIKNHAFYMTVYVSFLVGRQSNLQKQVWAIHNVQNNPSSNRGRTMIIKSAIKYLCISSESFCWSNYARFR